MGLLFTVGEGQLVRNNYISLLKEFRAQMLTMDLYGIDN